MELRGLLVLRSRKIEELPPIFEEPSNFEEQASTLCLSSDIRTDRRAEDRRLGSNKGFPDFRNRKSNIQNGCDWAEQSPTGNKISDTKNVRTKTHGMRRVNAHRVRRMRAFASRPVRSGLSCPPGAPSRRLTARPPSAARAAGRPPQPRQLRELAPSLSHEADKSCFCAVLKNSCLSKSRWLTMWDTFR